MSGDEDSFERQALAYLLGRLSDEEAARFETRLLEEDRAEELSAIEDELIDRAAHVELRTEERGPFESHFRALPGREQKIQFARALYQAARASAPVSITHRPARRRLTGRTVWFAASRLAVAAAAAVVMFVALRGPRAPQDEVVVTGALDAGASVSTVKEPVPVPSPSPTPPLAPPAPVAPPEGPRGVEAEPPPVLLALALSSTRGAAEHELAIPARAKRVILSIDLEGEATFSAFRATLSAADGAIAWSANRLAADHSGALTLRIPATAIPPGKYRMAIGGVTANGPVEELGTVRLQVTRGLTPRH